MQADLTVDTLLAAIRHFLEADASRVEPLYPGSEEMVLSLYGVPGDDVMKAVLEARGGKLTIKVQEVPEALAAVVSDEVAGAQCDIWKPGEENMAPVLASPLLMVGMPPADLDDLKESTKIKKDYEAQRRGMAERGLADLPSFDDIQSSLKECFS